MTTSKTIIQDFKAGKYEIVIATASRMIEETPAHDLAWRALGAALLETGNTDAAITALRKSLIASPSAAETYFNLANALMKDNSCVHPLDMYRRAVQLSPLFTEANNNLGNALKDFHRFDESIAAYQKALTANPSYVEAFWNIAIIKLTQRKFSVGWRMYEWRWRKSHLEAEWIAGIHLAWDGTSSLEGKILLLDSEQGLGDSIQFFRFLTRLPVQAGNVIVRVEEPLIRLFRASLSIAPLSSVSVVSKSDPLPRFDRHCALMSLPHLLKLTPDDLAIQAPYLKAADQPTRNTPIESNAKQIRRVGLVWSGNPRLANDRNRSISLSKLLPCLPQGPQYFAIQKEVRSSDVEVFRTSNLIDTSSQLQDFYDTARLCETMDLIISVDTSVAHLAGSLFVQTWLLLPFTADWRWGTNGTTTVWYPTITLYRQSEDRSWDPVIRSVMSDLSKVLS
jgi:hypothetical protein